MQRAAVHRQLALLRNGRVVVRVDGPGVAPLRLRSAAGRLRGLGERLAVAADLTAAVAGVGGRSGLVELAVGGVADDRSTGAAASAGRDEHLGAPLHRRGAAATTAGGSDRGSLCDLRVRVRRRCLALTERSVEVRVAGVRRRRRRTRGAAAATVEAGVAGRRRRQHLRRRRSVAEDDRRGGIAPASADGERQGLARRDLDRRGGRAAETARPRLGGLDPAVVVEAGGSAAAALGAERLDGDLGDVLRHGPLDRRAGEREGLLEGSGTRGGRGDCPGRRDREGRRGQECGDPSHHRPLTPLAPAAGRAPRC